MHRKRETRHENCTSQLLKEAGLSAPIPVNYVDVGTGVPHEVFRVESYLRLFSLHNKIPLFTGHVHDLSLVDLFWQRYKCIDPLHPTFTDHRGREKFVLPCYVHADEGRTLKKSAIMIFNIQPVLGGNPDAAYSQDEMHTNMKYHSFATRFLLSTMVKNVYRKNSEPLYRLADAIAEELLEVHLGKKRVTVFIALMAIKGDWPILAKLGKLERFFGRQTRTKASKPKGICHLCLAGQQDIPYHDTAASALWRQSYLRYDPYKSPPPFAILPTHGALMYRFDIFHTALKGVHAELAGSAIAGLLVDLQDIYLFGLP